jgi:hypothetical protein
MSSLGLTSPRMAPGASAGRPASAGEPAFTDPDSSRRPRTGREAPRDALSIMSTLSAGVIPDQPDEFPSVHGIGQSPVALTDTSAPLKPLPEDVSMQPHGTMTWLRQMAD